ncbi:MAG: outer membrane protein assembly factor BamD [Verrucomicrobiota bacterium]
MALIPANMKRLSSKITLLSLAILLMSSAVQAAWWDPFNWFTDQEEELLNLRPASLEEEAEAKILFEDGQAALADGNEGRAFRRFKKISEDYIRTIPAPDALVEMSRIQQNRKQWNKAFETLQITLLRYPDYEGFQTIVAEQFKIATALMDGARGRFLWIIPTFKNSKKARQYFETVVANGPYSDYAPLALMNVAIVSDRRNEPEYAIDALDRMINIYPDNMLAADAYYQLAEVYSGLVEGPAYDQGSTREAISYYEDFLILFPDSPLIGDAESGLETMKEVYARSKYDLGEFYFVYRRNTTAALTFYNEAITVAPDSDSAASAQVRVDAIKNGARPPRFHFGFGDVWRNIRGHDLLDE